MFGYYLQIALRSVHQNLVLTALMVAATGVGIGASMTTLTTLVAMSGNPIPDKSSRLFAPQLDVFGPGVRRAYVGTIPDQLTYRDALALMRAHRGVRQTAMYAVTLNVSPLNGNPFQAMGRATYGDFFAMFEVPFRSGAPWGQREDDNRANVVVLSTKLADRVFPHIDPVGKTITLNARDYRVVGVARPWAPTPHFYDVTRGNAFGEPEEFFLPFSTAIDRQIDTAGNNSCNTFPVPGWKGHLDSDCTWLQFWVELSAAGQAGNFRSFLRSYADQQRQQGRFNWSPQVDLHDVMGWITYNHVVPESARVNVMIALGFLLVCLVNAVGLMVAKFTSRGAELGLRRALGASRRDLFLQCLTETVLVGILGGFLGLGLTSIGLSGLRRLLEVASDESVAGHLVSLNMPMVLITMTVAITATVCSGLYPTLRASRIQPAWQLKIR